MRDSRFKAASQEAKALLDYIKKTELNCRIWYAYGRSLFKTNNVTLSQRPLTHAGKYCKGIRNDLGAKSLYIAAKGLDRKKQYENSAKLFALIPQNYPKHSMADDGYLLAGIGYQKSDQLEKALPMWQEQAKNFSDGDMIFEGYWRLAWGLYLKGKTD